MSDNLKIWDALSRTDPAHTKKFKRAGGFSGTSIKPIYMTRKMTEHFGPAGKGWGMNEPKFEVVHTANQIAVYCTVSIWWETLSQCVFGVGGDIVAGSNKNGPFTDDEAFKKSYTDALSNAMKQIGVGADVHMGQHDDDKYVAELRSELAKDESEAVPSEDERLAISAIDACKSREEITALLNREKDSFSAIPNGGANRIRDRANQRLKTEFPKAKEAA